MALIEVKEKPADKKEDEKKNDQKTDDENENKPADGQKHETKDGDEIAVDTKGGEDDKADNNAEETEKNKNRKWLRIKKEVRKKSAGSRRNSDGTSRALHEVDPFLKRFALSDSRAAEYELHRCLDIFSKTFWKEFIVDPSKTFNYRWLGIVSVAVMYNLMVVILRAVFYEEQAGIHHIWLIFDYLCDVIYLIDMFVMSRTAYLEQGLLERDKKKLARMYIQSWGFTFDVISLLPTDFLYFAVGLDGAYIRFNRVFKTNRLRLFFQMMETRSSFPNALRISNLILYILVICHWNGCVYYAFSKALGFGTDEWVYPDVNIPRYSTFVHKFSFSFYRSVLMLTTIGDELLPGREEEYMFVVINSLVGVLIFATIFGNVGGMISNMNKDREEFQNKVDAVKQYMAIRAVGKDLEGRVIRWFDYTWNNKQSVDDSAALGCLPDKLKAEISIRVHMDTLKRVAIFQDCEPGLLAELVLKLKLQVFSPGDYVCRKGDIGKEMYIVKRGRLNVVSEDGKTVFVTLTDGAVFGEVSTLNIAGNKTGNRRTASVRSVGYSDLFCLNKHSLWDALQEYPDAKKMLSEKGKQILRKDNLLDEETARRDERRQQAFDQKVDNILDSVMDLQADVASLVNSMRTVTATLASSVNAKEKSSLRVGKSSSATNRAPPPQPPSKQPEITKTSPSSPVEERKRSKTPPKEDS